MPLPLRQCHIAIGHQVDLSDLRVSYMDTAWRMNGAKTLDMFTPAFFGGMVERRVSTTSPMTAVRQANVKSRKFGRISYTVPFGQDRCMREIPNMKHVHAVRRSASRIPILSPRRLSPGPRSVALPPIGHPGGSRISCGSCRVLSIRPAAQLTSWLSAAPYKSSFSYSAGGLIPSIRSASSGRKLGRLFMPTYQRLACSWLFQSIPPR